VPDPVADAHAPLVVVQLLYRARASAARHGVQGADRAARALVPLGRRLRAAVEAAEAAPEGSAERAAALAEVVRVGELVRVDDAWEGIGGVLAAAIAGVRGGGEKSRKPPDRWGQ
jgi:hypothetical protein